MLCANPATDLTSLVGCNWLPWESTVLLFTYLVAPLLMILGKSRTWFMILRSSTSYLHKHKWRTLMHMRRQNSCKSLYTETNNEDCGIARQAWCRSVQQIYKMVWLHFSQIPLIPGIRRLRQWVLQTVYKHARVAYLYLMKRVRERSRGGDGHNCEAAALCSVWKSLQTTSGVISVEHSVHSNTRENWNTRARTAAEALPHLKQEHYGGNTTDFAQRKCRLEVAIKFKHPDKEWLLWHCVNLLQDCHDAELVWRDVKLLPAVLQSWWDT